MKKGHHRHKSASIDSNNSPTFIIKETYSYLFGKSFTRKKSKPGPFIVIDEHRVQTNINT